MHEYNIHLFSETSVSFFDEFEKSKIHISYNFQYLLGQNSSHTTLTYVKNTAEGNIFLSPFLMFDNKCKVVCF